MKVIKLDNFKNSGELTHLTLALGNFDGLHKGHMALIDTLLDKANGETGVYLFDANPADFFPSPKSHYVLTTLEDKIRILSSLKVDYAFVRHLSTDFFKESKDDFLSELKEQINPELVVVGSDYTFGSLPQGHPSDLRKAFPTVSVPLLFIEGQKVSTQEIIGAIQNGKIEKANFLLGRDYEIMGKVGHGFANGRKIGFPTANLVLSSPYVLPRSGVYKGLCYSRGLAYPSIINVGTNPTVGLLKHPLVECYLQGMNEEIYDETLYVSFGSFLREEMKFASLEELKKQLGQDILSLTR